MTPPRTDVRRAAPSLPNGFSATPTIATGGQPSPEDIDSLAAAGYRTILDLREPVEPRGFNEPEAVSRAGLHYVNIAIGSQTPDERVFDDIRSLLRDPAHGPILVHCASGNRVGFALLPWMVLDQQMSLDAAMEAAHQMGLRSPALARIAINHVARVRAGEV